MKVAINALPVQPGGGLTVIKGLVRGLKIEAPEIELDVLTSSPSTFSEVEALGMANRVHQIMPDARNIQLFLWQSTLLGRWLRREHIDVLLTINHHLSNIPCSQIVYHLNLLRFQKLHPLRGFAKLVDSVRDRAARRALFVADANVFESRFLKEAAESSIGRPANNSQVIYIGLPDTLLALKQTSWHDPSTSRRLVAITSPHPHKDNGTLVRTLAELVHREPNSNWQLDIAGGANPAVWNSVRELANSLGVGERITWHGYCDEAKLTQLLMGGLCLIATSQLESFAMVPVEAMARGCPPIVANCASMPESVGDAGILAKPGSASSFADAAFAFAHQPDLRRSKVNAGERWIKSFRWATCGRQFSELLRRTVATERQSSTFRRRAA